MLEEFKNLRLKFEADKGAGGGGNVKPDAEQKPPESEQKPPEGEQKPPEEGKVEDLPGWAQKIITELRDEDAKKRIKLKDVETAEKQAAEARRVAEEARLKEQEDWKGLAEKHAAELEKLRPNAASYDRVAEAFKNSIEKRMATLPQPVRELASKIADLVDLSAWLDENADKLAPRQAPNLDGGQQGDNKDAVKLSPQEIEAARKTGMTPEEYAAMKVKIAAKK